MYASSSGHLDIVQLLVSYGAAVNAETAPPIGYQSSDEGATALIYASSRGDKEIVEYLISKGADVNAKKNNGYNAIILGLSGGHKDIVQMLIEKGADVNAETTSGKTPLWFALKKKYFDMAQLLVANGANIRAKSLEGLIVRYLRRGEEQVVEFLPSQRFGQAVDEVVISLGAHDVGQLLAYFHRPFVPPRAFLVAVCGQRQVIQRVRWQCACLEADAVLVLAAYLRAVDSGVFLV